MGALALAILALGAPAVTPPSPPPSCRDSAGFDRLDFWLGDWDVFVGDARVGHNHIEPILDGCAVRESWRGAEGDEGQSLFYRVPARGTWKQVWITDRATALGGMKEKSLLEGPAPGVRFQGEIPLTGGGTYLDRTTLTPNPDGSVRQLIEISRDAGKTWTTMFDARYVRSAGGGSP